MLVLVVLLVLDVAIPDYHISPCILLPLLGAILDGAEVRRQPSTLARARGAARPRTQVMPTAHIPNDALFAQFACIRSLVAKTCDDGSGGRGFESLPARKPNSAL
jgi:hypothetical protein